MESNKQERKNLVDMDPIQKESAVKMMKSKKPSTDFALKMSGTKAALPMNMEGPLRKAAKPDYIDIDKDGNTSEPMKDAAKGSPAQMYGGKKGDMSKSKKDYEAPTKMYAGKKGDMSKSRRDYE